MPRIAISVVYDSLRVVVQTIEMADVQESFDQANNIFLFTNSRSVV